MVFDQYCAGLLYISIGGTNERTNERMNYTWTHQLTSCRLSLQKKKRCKGYHMYSCIIE